MADRRNPYYGGLLAGSIAIIAINLAEFLMRILNISETTLWQAGGAVFLAEKALMTPLGIGIGIFSHILVSLFMAIIITYYLQLTGKDYAILKGLSISLAAMFVFFGLVFPIRNINLSMQNSAKDVLSAFIDHIIFGLVVGLILGYIYDKTPSKVKSKQQKPKFKSKRFVLLPAQAKKTIVSKIKSFFQLRIGLQ